MKSYLQSTQLFSDATIEAFMLKTRIKYLEKGDFFIRAGEYCQEVGFVEEGICRSFYSSQNKEEVTYCFSFPNNLLAAYSSFISNSPSQENLQALTAMKLCVISKYELDKLIENSSTWLLFAKILAEQQYLELEQRIFLLQREKAIVRYEDLLKKHPTYLQQVPLQYLASYLGISMRHLSRIRNTLAK